MSSLIIHSIRPELFRDFHIVFLLSVRIVKYICLWQKLYKNPVGVIIKIFNPVLTQFLPLFVVGFSSELAKQNRIDNREKTIFTEIKS